MHKNLLVIGFVWPEPNSSAAGSRMMQLIEVFQSDNYFITFASPCAKSINAFDLESIGVICQDIELNNSSFDVFVKELNPNIVLFDRFMMEEQFGWRVTEQCPNALRILDTEDLHCLRKGRHLAFKDEKPFDESYLFNEIAKREIASIYRCDLSLIISEAEMEILKNQLNVNKNLLLYLPFLLDEISITKQGKLPKFQQRNHFVTIGNFLHAPNIDAVLYLKKAIWPLIRKQLPKTEMHVYGSYSSQKVIQSHSEKDGFIIKGYAEDVNEIMQSAKVCLAPLRFGAGLKGKMVDAMQNGTPCVTTTIGAEGLFGNLEPNGFIEDKTIGFANNAVDLYRDQSLWETNQLNGFRVINQRFDVNQFQKLFLKVIETIQENLKLHRQENFIGNMLQYHLLKSTKFMSKWIEEKNKRINP